MTDATIRTDVAGRSPAPVVMPVFRGVFEMVWQRAKRRHEIDAARFVATLCREFSARELGRLCGVSDRTVRRWRDGTDWPTADVLTRLVDRLFPQSEGSGPIYSPEMAIDANTRVGGVGEYTIRAARGEFVCDEKEDC